MKRIMSLCLVAAPLLFAACGDDPAARAPTPTQRAKAADGGRETIYAGVAKTRGVLELDGGVRLTTDGAHATTIDFAMTLSADAAPMRLDDPTAPIAITFIDAAFVEPRLAYSVDESPGDGDGLLEPGEAATISVDLAAACPGCAIGPDHTFTLEIKPPNGSYLVIQRTTPATLEAAMDLG